MVFQCEPGLIHKLHRHLNTSGYEPHRPAPNVPQIGSVTHIHPFTLCTKDWILMPGLKSETQLCIFFNQQAWHNSFCRKMHCTHWIIYKRILETPQRQISQASLSSCEIWTPAAIGLWFVDTSPPHHLDADNRVLQTCASVGEGNANEAFEMNRKCHILGPRVAIKSNRECQDWN